MQRLALLPGSLEGSDEMLAAEAGFSMEGLSSAWCRCGHCKHLTPEYKKLGEAVAASPKLKDRVVIAKVSPC